MSVNIARVLPLTIFRLFKLSLLGVNLTLSLYLRHERYWLISHDFVDAISAAKIM